jgi:hypothetical protein
MTSSSDEIFPMEDYEDDKKNDEFGKLIRYTLSGYMGGLILGLFLNMPGFHRSVVGQWLVRIFPCEGESLLEGLFAVRRRLRRAQIGMAEAYGWGKFVCMTILWWIDAISRALGMDVYHAQGSYIRYFYAVSDQIGGNLIGLILLQRSSKPWREALSACFRHPVMVS